MKTAVVIPARKGSSRFPGKVLTSLHGVTVLERTLRIAREVRGIDAIVVATDDSEILRAAKQMGADACMTPPECRNGSERTWAATVKDPRHFEIIVNLQADAVLTPPWVVQAAVDELRANPDAMICTPATALLGPSLERFIASKQSGKTTGTSVVFDQAHRALYFSKGVVPFLRNPDPTKAQVFRHIGLYAYRRVALERYVSLPPSRLEEIEGLEQLRALENGIPIQIVEVDYRGRSHWSVDNPEDIAIIEKIIRDEGELVCST